MSKLSRLLFTLTISEYTELNKGIIREQFKELFINQEYIASQKLDRDIIFIDEACKLTGYSKPTMYSKISRYEIPVLSRGKPLTFSKKEIIDWIYQGKPIKQEKKTNTYVIRKNIMK